MNAVEFALLALFVIFAFIITRHRLREVHVEPANGDENARLRTQVKQLQDRIQVLERIVTDRGVETAAQIEALRDREQIENGDKIQ